MEPSLQVGERLLDGIRARDYDAIARCFGTEAVFDVLTPHRLREHRGRDEIVARYAHWLDPMQPLEIVDADVGRVADRIRVRYRFRGRDPEKGWQLNEHTAYARVEDDLIVSATLTCSGFRPDEAPA